MPPKVCISGCLDVAGLLSPLQSEGGKEAMKPSRNIASFVRLFKPQFAHAVQTGKKCQTVRPTPKRMPKPGDKISLRCWTDKPFRSKQRVLREAIISRVEEIDIYECAVRVCKDNGKSIRVVDRDREAFARLDGFVSWAEMREWFRVTHGLPFRGVLISWMNAKPELPQ